MTTHALVSPAPPRTILLLWLGLALTVGASGILTSVPPPGPQLILLGLATLAVWGGTRAGRIREWIDRLPLQAFPALHLIRFVGIWFLFQLISGAGTLGAGGGGVAYGAHIGGFVAGVVLVRIFVPRRAAFQVV